MYLKGIFKKTTLWILSSLSLIFAVFVYATVDRTVAVTEQMIIVPGVVESDSWSDVENILIKDLGEDSIYQDFSKTNSAYIDFLSLEPTSVNDNDSASGTDLELGVDVNTDNTSEQIDENISEENFENSESVPESEAESVPETTTESEPEPEPESEPEPVSGSEPVSFYSNLRFTALSLLPKSTGRYPLAQEIIETPVTIEDGVVNQEQIIDETPQAEEVIVDESPQVEEVNEEVVDDGEQAIEEVNDEITVDETPQAEEVGELFEDENTNESPSINDFNAESEDVDTEESEVGSDSEVFEDVPKFDINEACAGDANCKLYSTTFTNFDMPEFDSGQFLATAQLRLSLAAKTKNYNEDETQRFVVEYSYGTSTWDVATVIDIEEEISTSLNGGYFLVSLEKPVNQSQLSNLKVRVSYQGDISNIERAYIEGLWLEVTSAKFYEETDPEYLSGAIDYSRDLLAPEFHELNNSDLDPAMSELPSFTLSYSPQQNFLKRAFTALFGENKYSVDSVRITNATGEVVTVPVDVEYHDDKTWTVQFLEQPQKMVPGKYTVELVVDENESLYTDRFEFYWGVLAVNTTKSMYFAGEEITLNLAALTEKGDTICDASLSLKIVDPEYTIHEIPVEQSGACGKNNVTDIPDYLAYFKETNKLGRYTIQLQHLNREGEVVHNIQDHFEVREYIPFDIERTAPTRIYPPAPYTVSLKIKANREFTGDIKERVPRGFVITEAGDSELLTEAEYNEIIWRNVSLKEGEEIELSYTFDAPNISPYMYLLGPLDMDGFTELRQWQIASDALTAIASFTGTRTVAGTNLNQTASPFEWSTSTLDNFYYSHSSSTNSHEITIRQDGDYYLSVNLPQQRNDANSSRTRVGVEVRINGVAVPQGLGRSGYIRNANGHAESSSQVHFLLQDIQADDVVTVYAEGLTTIDAGDIVNVSGQASMYLEYIGATETVFAATTTQTTNSTNLNQTTEYPFSWVETRQDSGFVHSDALNPDQIIISDPGTYYVSVNIPLTTNTAQANVRGRVLLDGVLVSGGHFKQGYSQSTAYEGDGDSSIHWSGIVVATTTNQILTIAAQREAVAGTVTVTSGFVGSVLVRELPSTDLIALSGTALVGGTNWNPAAAAEVLWSNQISKDATVFTHSTTTNSNQITIASNGDYFISFNDAIDGGVGRANTRISVLKNGVPITGAETKSHYIRNQNGHTESSASMAILIEGLLNGDIITVTTVAEANAGTLNDSTPALLLMWKKAQIDYRPDAPSMYNTPFDNIRFASTTPYFDFSAVDPDGASDIEYEFSISTSTGFTASTTFNSSVDSEFSNTVSPGDTSPFTEGNKIRLQLTGSDALTDLTTYYWRVRARDVSGSNEFGDWSTTQSLTVDMAAEAPSWYQSYSGQFEGDTLVGTVSSGDNQVVVDATVSGEVLIAYGEGSVTTPRYRLWNGSTWGVEGDALSVSGAINWVRTAAGVTRDEYAMITLDSANDSYVQIYSASTSSWGNLALMSPAVASVAYRGVALSYESTSGDAMAVSCTNSPNPVYRIWDGTAWSATSTIPVSSINNCNFVELASDPASDEMILVVRDTGTQYETFVWNGSAWTDSRIIGSSAKVAREGIAVAYETSGDQAVIAVSNNTGNNIIYTTWNGTEFSTNATQVIGNDFEFGRIATDPNSDEMALCYIDEDNDIGVLRWDGGVWLTYQEMDTGGNADTGRPVECVFETSAGRSDYLMVSYSDTTNARYRTATSTIYSTEVSVGTIEDSHWVQTERAGDGTIIMVALDDVADDLDASIWNGTTWSSEQTLESDPSSLLAPPYEMYDLSAKRFQFSEGVVVTPPIDFAAVPSQPNWGDINFSSDEPFGTDVKVSVRYTNTLTCDTLIPDLALPGNSAGFDVLNLPIDLTSLSTSTYNQICLEATLTTLGSASAALNEWTLSWVRQPKLVQSNYKWYVNGSFITPTDAWPQGAIDVAEDSPITSDMAISINEAIRLRLGLRGSNIELPAFSEAFKLQYAEGSTCNIGLDWRDVGELSSTTALWRGYANSIVGDDWYNANWTRRVKITVDEGVVMEGLTDFPTYLNLADLPNEFFSNVQSDGRDIRITKNDGLTEVPFELVSIDTVLKTGELHFKSDLASTTDTEFFVYYNNPSASAYSATATYGSRNVWTNNFRIVYHFNQNPTGAAPQFVDSTGNTSGSSVNLESGDLQAGRVGNAINFDGVNEYISTNLNSSIATSTWSIWMNPNTMPQGAYDGVMFSRGTNTSGINFNSTANRLGYHWNDSASTYGWNGGPSVPGSQWTMAALLIGQSSANGYLFTATGTASGTNTTTHTASTINSLFFGGDTCCGGRYYNGLLDEARLATVKRTVGWMQTEFNNLSNPSGFYDVSSEEKVSDGRLLPSVLLSVSDIAETYEEENPTRENQNAIPIDDVSEWDFVLQNNGAESNTNYCFRMVYLDGSLFSQYEEYPRLVTNAAPLAPELFAPFDNERLASTTPWFEFETTDELGDEVSYQIQVDADSVFGSPDIDTDSISQFALFTNLLQPAQKSQFTNGQRIRFESPTTLSNNTTYWWRVRAQDPDGSGGYGEWSTPNSFTVTSGTSISTWYQTTGEQFATNNLLDAVSDTGTDDVGIDTTFALATVTSNGIDFDDGSVGNAWGDLSFTQNVTSGSVTYKVEYLVSANNYALVPDIDLPGNSTGFTASPVSLTGLDINTYNELRLVAVLSGNSSLPRLLDWTVTWAETMDVPTVIQPFDNAKVSTTTPSFTFFSVDPENEDIQYELQTSSSYDFSASSTYLSGVDLGFVNTVNGGDTSPFNSSESVRFALQTPLVNGNTYWWRVRAKDPTGSDAWSDYSVPQSFTVDTAVTVSAWYQTTGEQFATDALADVVTTSGTAEITTTVNEVLMAYGEGTGQAPRYRIWDGSVWGDPATAASVGAQIRWIDLEAAPTRPEYAIGTIGTDSDVNVQIYDADNDVWGNVFELTNNVPDYLRKGMDVAYEISSGNLMAVTCDGTDALYAVWNGSSWSATSSIALSNANNCLTVEMSSDPNSDEIIAVFKHTNASTPDFELMVWNGSSWGNALALADMNENANSGTAVMYEESGDQAIVALTNNVATTLLYALWNGSAWSTTTVALGDHIEWASLKRNVGSDEMALCYIDNDSNIGFIRWNGSAWNTFTEIEAAGNSKGGQPIDCEYETTSGREGYLMMPYSDGTNGRYQFFDGVSPSGELTLNAIQDSWRVIAERGGDGTIHTVFLDDALDRYEVTSWDGSAWASTLTITNPAITGTPFDGSFDFAARTYPNFTSGSVRSTDVDFSSGSGPRWERVLFNDTTPGSSLVEYRLYYLSSTTDYILIPDTALPGNSAGFTTSPIDISDLDRTIYETLQLDADFVCLSGDCPILNDWTVEWSEGISVSGVAYDYNASTTLTSGTVAVAVNGVLQSGKTGTISGDGSWTINNVTVFPGDVVAVFIDGALDNEEGIGVTKYDGVGDITNMQIARRHVTLGSLDNPNLSNADIGAYNIADDEDLFLSLNVSNELTLCSDVACGDAKLRILTGATYTPSTNGSVINFENYGTFSPATSTMRVRSGWSQNGTFNIGESTIIFTATSTSDTLISSSTSHAFYNATFGESSGTSTWAIDKPLAVSGNLTVNYGTLNRGTSTINIGRNLQFGSNGTFSGVATTTFDGSGSYTWGDSKSVASSTNAGYVVVDGTAKTITLAGNVGAESVTIGTDDTLNASGSGYNISVYKTWINNNSFIPQSGTVTFVGTTTGEINRGSSAFNNLTFSGVGGNWSFTTPTLALNGNLTIATGTVTLPTGTTTVAGNFTNAGNFLHNNGEVRMTSTSAGKTITQSGTAFLNNFNDLVFSGTGAWSFTESSATTTRHFRIQSGSVTFPSTNLTVGGNFQVTGSGAFAHNNGQVTFLVENNYETKANGSSFNNVRTAAGAVSWYNKNWSYRLPVIVNSSSVTSDLTDYPIYINLDDLPASFFTNVKTDGSDIRVTTADGITEVPYELVSINTISGTGELHAKVNLADATDTNIYIYYGNSAATAYAVGGTYGRNNVWSNGYLGVYHLNESPTGGAPQFTDSTGSSTGTANNMEAGDLVAGQIGNGINVDGSNEYITTTFNRSISTSTWTYWGRANGVQNAYDGIVFSRSSDVTGFGVGTGGTNLSYHWQSAGATAYNHLGPAMVTNEWYMAALVVRPTYAELIRYAASGIASTTNTATHNASTINDLQFGRDDTGGRLFNGIVDEVRLANVARTKEWLQTEYNNHSSTTSFYSTGAAESRFIRTFSDTNATILGNLLLDIGGDAVFPTGTLSVGGSFTNNAEFNANGGTVRFNSTAGSETIDAGESSFSTLTFDSTAGDFTVVENATATTAINLTSAVQFTLANGKILTTLGTFTNAADGANTTWTGSTLRLLSGTEVSLNNKVHGGDVYDTLEAASSTTAKMWNSSAVNYSTSGLTGSIYSQDHAGVDGDLNIYGNYVRTTGTEYWNYGTDFDGTVLGGSGRQVDVRVASSSQVKIQNATLSIVGSAAATTTIGSISNTFSLVATSSTLHSNYANFSGTDLSGLSLLSSTTIGTFTNTDFVVVPGRSGITIDATTVDKNAAGQYFNVNFATTTAGIASNVTLSGSPASYVWFRNGSGNLYGEAFDVADGNPGAIRFDDSSYLITVSGVVYSDDGVTPMGSPTCDGVTPNVRIVIDGGTYSNAVACNASTGAYTFSGVAYVGDPSVVVYLNTNGASRGVVVSKTPTANITNFDIYANRVIVRHEDTLPLSIIDMIDYDNGDDSDIPFVATDDVIDTLVVEPNTELFVFTNKTFSPNGNITLLGNGNSNSYEGTLQIASGAAFIATSTETHTLAGRFVLASTTSSFVAASSTFVFNATTTGKSIMSSNSVTFNEIEFSGIGGAWNITAPLIVNGNMAIDAGTVTGTSDITIINGSLSGNGTLSLGLGTTTINNSNTFGGSTSWTLNNLILGSGSTVGTTTMGTSATTTILGRLTIANAHFLDADNTIWDLAGTGNVFVESGTFIEDTSTIRYSGAGANVLSTSYYNLLISAGVGSATYTTVGSGVQILNDLLVGGGTNSVFTLNTNDQLLVVNGNVNIATNGTLEASDSALLTIQGDLVNAGILNGNGGTILFNGSGTTNIYAGNASLSNIEINGVGDYVVEENATSTGNWSLIAHNNFTVNGGTTLAVGGIFLNNIAGTNTSWTGSTLRLFGNGTYEINDSSTNDNYETLSVGANTHVRTWNSLASTYDVDLAGSVYSQDHNSVNGNLYIYGNLIRTSGDDYWSYLTDFDGTDLTGGNERQASVYFANGASATYEGVSTLSVFGTSTATTTLANQGSGVYGVTIGGTAETDWSYVEIRNIDSDGVTFSGSPLVTDFSYTDHLITIDNATAITVGGTVINTNEAKNFTTNSFVADVGVINAKNVTATGTSVSSWRFTNHIGNIAGEAYDNDPAGDPGYLVFDDSAALITVSGNVYSDEGSTVSSICDGSTSNIRLVVAGLTTYNTSCNASTGAYSISSVAFSPLDTLTLYINDEVENATNVTIAPISSISNMHLYEDRVIVRHENTNPLTIADMAVWDSSDDADVLFTATDSITDTLLVPSDTKFIIWSGKTFEPNGDVTISGGGSGSAYDGTLEAQNNSRFRAKGIESHSVGGSVVFNTGAEFVSGSSTLALTSTASGRTFDVNSNSLHNLTLSGSGSYSVIDSTLNIFGTYAQSSGGVTMPTGTTTIGASYNVTGGSFVNNGSPIVFTGTGAQTVRFNNSEVASLRFNGAGTFTMSDTNATSTDSVVITAGTVVLPSGNLTVGGNFEKRAGSITHNTSELIMTSGTSALITASTSDLFGIKFTGSGNFTITDQNITFLDSFTVENGSVQMASGTTAIGGSILATGGTFVHATGTVLLNTSGAGRVINPGNSTFHNLQIGAPSGGYTLYSATTTNNFIISGANILTVDPTATIYVGGVFTNSVGGAGTTWTGSTLVLDSGTGYSINTRLNNGDVYGNIIIGNNTDIRSWYSSAASVVVASSGSLYSQDNANVNGALYIYGDLDLATSTEYWNYANDFDGTVLTGGNERIVTVSMAANSTTTLNSGTLQILGASGFETVIQNQGSGTYSLEILGGTFNAQHYEFNNLNIEGLKLQNTPVITNLSNGLFNLAVDTGSLITLSSTTLNANPSKTFNNVGFAASGISGYNINLVGETDNAWRITNNYGNIGGEGFDIDGIDACGSIRFDNSSCLLTEQTHFRWRNDDGGEGAANSEWFDMSWTYRTKVRVLNNDNQSYASTAVKVVIPYDSAMKSDFSDLRFTSDDGVSPIPFYIEKYTASTEVQVWVRLPNLAASDYEVVYVYYGNSGASDASSVATFDALDDYEDGNISEYSGDTSLFNTVTSPIYGGARALAPTNTSGKTTDGIFRFDQTITQGKMVRYMQYVNTTSGSGDEPCTLFGVQSPGTTNQNYGVCLEQFGTDRISLSRDVDNNDSSGVIIASSTVSYSTGWYEVEIDWGTDNVIRVKLYNSGGTQVASISATDSTYTSGGYGYAFWFQNGAWDSFMVRNRVVTTPTVYLGVRQGNGGATWSSNLDASGSAIPNDIVRLRLSIENSGLDITGHQYLLEYSPKGTAPSCESVSATNFIPVPDQSTCGSSPVCMQSSTNIADGDSTTDLLFGVDGTFSSGKITEDPSVLSAVVDIDQNYYTEIEYVLTPTNSASDSYCFRVTNNGTDLDFYAKVAELGLQFDPTFGAVNLNGGLDISLIPGTTTPVVVSGLVNDFNGYADLTHATATIYRSGAGSACTPDNNNCYVATTENGQCSFTACSGSECTLSCQVDIFFHADPTDTSPYEGEEWLAYAEAEDFNAGYDFASASGVELNTVRALSVDSLINYGAIEAASNTGSFNPTTTVTNLGNVPIDIDVQGIDLTDGSTSIISAENQKLATSTFSYDSCVSCQYLSTTTPVSVDVNLGKPSVIVPPVETDLYWGIAIPFSASSAAHSGTNIFTAIGVD